MPCFDYGTWIFTKHFELCTSTLCVFFSYENYFLSQGLFFTTMGSTTCLAGLWVLHL